MTASYKKNKRYSDTRSDGTSFFDKWKPTRLSLWLQPLLLIVFLWFASTLHAADYLMCDTTESSDSSGTLYDSGGPSGDYSGWEVCFFSITPTGSPAQITLSFSEFDTDSSWGTLVVYDGGDDTGSFLGSFSGSSLPGDLVATSGSIYLAWSSGITSYPGFAATWTTSSGDSTPPAAITDLAAGSATASSITLTWTAPGDDGNSGTATSYDVRYSTSPINDTNWASATQAASEPAPQSAGSSETFIVNGLDSGTTYYFAVKTVDEAANESGLSNIASGITLITISGRVFEDVQYGGGSGRNFAAASGGVGRVSVTVELYNSSGDFLSSVSTDTNGQYTFSEPSAASYSVRVVNSTVTSSRSGADGTEVAVQTFRADGDGESAGAGTNKVGGEQPQSTDAPANSGSDTLSDLQSPAGQYTQSIVSVDTSGGSLADIDFGFNFDTIVNTNNSGQGSLRQFILNANLLANSGLDQDDWAVAKSAGVEHSIFMIPLTDSGYGADPTGGGGNAFVIQMDSTALADITDADTAIDGRTQTAFTGDTNGSVANTSTGPEVVVDFTDNVNDFYFSSVRGYLYDVGIYRGGGDQSVRFASVTTSGSVVQNVTIYQSVNSGLFIAGSDGVTVADSVFRDNGTGSGTADGILLNDGSDNTITGNAFVANANTGIELWSGTSQNNVISQNYIANTHIGVYINSGSQNTISQNTITNNSKDGIVIGTNATGNTITRNAIYANGELGIELSADGSYSGDGVTANDANDGDSGANDLLNYPVITAATETGGTISIDFDLDLPAGDYRIEFFKNPSGADPSGYGEGESFAGEVDISHPGGGTQGFSHSFSGAVGDIITATTTTDPGGGSYGSTSEFSATYTATYPPPNIDLTRGVAVISDPFNNTTNPKVIPGAVLDYTVTVTNQGLGPTDADTVIITNPVGDQNMLFVDDLAGAGSGPVSFSDGSTASGLTCTFSSLASATDSISFSNNNGSTYTYTPTPDADGYDAAVTHVRVSPAGTFAASDGSNHPAFSFVFRVKVR